MENLSDEKVSDIADKVIQECNIYPQPSKENVKKEIIKSNKILENNQTEISEKKLINRVTKSFEIKGQICNSEWIMYNGNTINNKR
jgi:hypothetical protein